MANPNADKICRDEKCEYNYPFMKPHYHVQTNDGGYVRYIVEKTKVKEYHVNIDKEY